MVDFDESCFTEISDFADLLDLCDDDFESAKSSQGRLDKVEPVPTALQECNNIQKRIVCYFKIFNYIWVAVYSRQTIPICIAARVRMQYKSDISDAIDNIDTEFK